jgi:RNA polymerase sigma factor (sigma-70 family)
MTDEAYLAMMQAGDMTGLIALQRKYRAAILACAYSGFRSRKLPYDSISTPQHLAEETWHDFALHVMKHGYEHINNIVAYVCSMAKAKAGDIADQRGGKKIKYDPFEDIYPSKHSIERDFIDKETSAERTLHAFAIFYQLVSRQDIPARQRLAMFLRDYGGMSSKEIGEMLEVAPSSVDSMVSQARAKLRRVFGVKK